MVQINIEALQKTLSEVVEYLEYLKVMKTSSDCDNSSKSETFLSDLQVYICGLLQPRHSRLRKDRVSKEIISTEL